MIALELPFPPSVNTMYRRSGQHMHLSNKGRQYKADVFARLIEQGRPKLAGRVAIEIELFPPDLRRRDLDNSFKGILDSISGPQGVIADDSQIDDLRIVRREVVKFGCVLLKLWPMK